MSGRERRLISLEQQLASYKQELEAVSGLAERGYYPRNKLLGIERERARIEGDLGTTQAELAKLQEVLTETRLQVQQIEQKQTEEVSQQLAEVRARLAEAREKLGVAADVLYRVDVRSPRRGLVLGVKVNGPGTVVAPGAMLAEVVPQDDALVISARVSPLDVQNVSAGQKAEIRFPGLSNRRTPPISGKVATVSADSLVDEATREPYFAARVLIDRSHIPEELSRKITPGMPADVLITTGERTAIDYLIGPLRDSLAKSMREK